MNRLRRLNNNGIEIFISYIESLALNPLDEVPYEILTDPTTSETIEPEILIEKREFPNRFAAAEYLYQRLGKAEINSIARDRGLWAWLSLMYFDQLCPKDNNGKRKIGELARLIPAVGDFRKYYRHLLAGPFSIYRTYRDNPDRAYALLSNPLHQPGEIAEQLSAYQQIVTNAAIIEAATILYIDKETMQSKRGAGGKGPGSARRLPNFWSQFDVTWDLYSMTSNEILDMLPHEFDRFKSTN